MRVAKKILPISAMLLLAACGGDEPLTIAAAESAGFEKKQQQLYQMVDAIDGWSGQWAGDTVELYVYETPDTVKRDAFPATSVQPGNLSGWVEMCVVRNMLMLSKGSNACAELEALAK